jgi:copper chaperone CopZ
MTEIRLIVPEMSCEACVATVSGALEAMPGVTAVEINLETKLVRVEHEGDRTDLVQLQSAVEDQGYEVDDCEVL